MPPAERALFTALGAQWASVCGRRQPNGPFSPPFGTGHAVRCRCHRPKGPFSPLWVHSGHLCVGAGSRTGYFPPFLGARWASGCAWTQILRPIATESAHRTQKGPLSRCLAGGPRTHGGFAPVGCTGLALHLRKRPNYLRNMGRDERSASGGATRGQPAPLNTRHALRAPENPGRSSQAVATPTVRTHAGQFRLSRLRSPQPPATPRSPDRPEPPRIPVPPCGRPPQNPPPPAGTAAALRRVASGRRGSCRAARRPPR